MKKICLVPLALLLAWHASAQSLNYDFSKQKIIDSLRARCWSFNNFTLQPTKNWPQYLSSDSALYNTSPSVGATGSFIETEYYRMATGLTYSIITRNAPRSTNTPNVVWTKMWLIDQAGNKRLTDSVTYRYYGMGTADVYRSDFQGVIFPGTYKIRIEYGGTDPANKVLLQHVSFSLVQSIPQSCQLIGYLKGSFRAIIK